MSSFLYFILGVLLLCLTALDIIRNVFPNGRSGPVSKLVSKGVWKVFFFVSGRNGRSALLEFAGPAILFSILWVWIIGMWSGLLFILLSDQNSVRNSSTLVPADWVEKLYFAGSTITGLGPEGYEASGKVWQIVTSVFPFLGFTLFIAAVTFSVRVLSAVHLQRKIGLYIAFMGKTPQQILINCWGGNDFASFVFQISLLEEMIARHTHNLRLYPVVLFFHSSQEAISVKRALVVLDEALQLLTYAVPKDSGADPFKLSTLRSALDAYINFVKGRFFKSSLGKELAPIPDLMILANEGIPIDSEGAGYFLRQDIKRHRQQLTALLKKDGWSWQDIYLAKKLSPEQEESPQMRLL